MANQATNPAPAFPTAQALLQAASCMQTIHWSSEAGPRRPKIAAWNPDAPWNGTDSRGSYLARYGVVNEGLKGGGSDPSQADVDHSLLTSGTMVGETGIAQAVLDQLPAKLTSQDVRDLMVVKHPSLARPFAAPDQASATPPTTPAPPPPVGAGGPSAASLQRLRAAHGDAENLLKRDGLDAGGGGRYAVALRALRDAAKGVLDSAFGAQAR